MATRAPAPEPLSSEDLEILESESTTVAGHTLKIAIVDPSERQPRPDAEALRIRVSERIARAPALRRRLQTRGRRAVEWVDDPAFDVSEHVRAAPVAEPISPDELRAVCARMMRERLDRSRPLWMIEVLDPLADGGIALVWKIHHSVADGTTAMRLARELLWDAAAGDREAIGGGESASPLGELLDAIRGRNPGRLPGAMRRELHRTRDPSPLDGVIGSSRVVAFASISLRSVRRAVKQLVPGATVNDAVLALVAGGLRRWQAQRGDPTGPVRVKVPVSLHHRSEREATANRDSFFCASLPVTEADPVERLRRINAETALCKRSGDARVLDTLLRDLGRVAPPLRRALERFTLDPRTYALNVSNVAGPAERPCVLGAPVRALYSIVEIREHHGLRVAVVSMADELHFGLCGDPTIVGDLNPFVAGIVAEASTLSDRAR